MLVKNNPCYNACSCNLNAECLVNSYIYGVCVFLYYILDLNCVSMPACHGKAIPKWFFLCKDTHSLAKGRKNKQTKGPTFLLTSLTGWRLLLGNTSKESYYVEPFKAK